MMRFFLDVSHAQIFWRGSVRVDKRVYIFHQEVVLRCSEGCKPFLVSRLRRGPKLRRALKRRVRISEAMDYLSNNWLGVFFLFFFRNEESNKSNLRNRITRCHSKKLARSVRSRRCFGAYFPMLSNKTKTNENNLQIHLGL